MESDTPYTIKLVSHSSFGNAPPRYFLVEIEVAGLFKIQGERNPHTNREFRWPDGFKPTERLTALLDRLEDALNGYGTDGGHWKRA